MGDNVKVIGENAFNGCSSLKNITLSKSLENIGNDAFLDCGIEYSQGRVVYYNGDITSWSNIEFSNSESTPMCFADKILFKDNGNYSLVTEIGILEGVTSINQYQFYGFRDVISLYLPSSVTSIGTSAFSYLSSLKYAEMPARSGLKVSSLEEVVISSNIPTSYFDSMPNLKKVTILEGVEFIGNNAFKNCSKLEEVIIPKTVTSIGLNLFESCDGLETLSIDKENRYYKGLEEGVGLVDKQTNTLLFGNDTSKIDSSIVHIGEKAFYNNTKLTTMHIPSSVKTIGDYAFYKCNDLNDLTLPTSIISIGKYAFYNCINITSADFSSYTALTTIGDYAFDNCLNINIISLPESLESIGTEIFDSKCKITEIEMPIVGNGFVGLFGTIAQIPSTLTTVNIISGDVTSNYFASCKTLTTINLKGTTSIGDNEFKSCYALTNVSIPEGVISLGINAFNYYTSLTQINLPNSLLSIGSGCFSYSGLEEITIPKLVKKLEYGVFQSCKKLHTISYQDNSSLEEVAGSVFYDCIALKELTIPQSVKKIAVGALYNLTNIEKLTISHLSYSYTYKDKEETTIYYLFDEMGYSSIPSTLKEVNLPHVTSIPDKAFINCSSITKITLSDGLTTIGSQAFYNCSNLEEINFPSSLESIGELAFYNTSVDESLIPNL